MYKLIVKLGQLVDDHFAVVMCLIYGISLVMFIESLSVENWDMSLIPVFIAGVCGTGMQLIHKWVNEGR